MKIRILGSFGGIQREMCLHRLKMGEAMGKIRSNKWQLDIATELVVALGMMPRWAMCGRGNEIVVD